MVLSGSPPDDGFVLLQLALCTGPMQYRLCGITVAPDMPTATYNIRYDRSGRSVLVPSPENQVGCGDENLDEVHTPIVAISRNHASMVRIQTLAGQEQEHVQAGNNDSPEQRI